MSTSCLHGRMGAKLLVCVSETELSELLVEGGARQCACPVTCAAHTQVSTEAVLHYLDSLDGKKPARCCLTCREWRRLWSYTMPQSCCTSQQHCRQRTSSTLTSSLTTCYSGMLPAQHCQPGIPADLACGPKLAFASLTMAELLTQLSCHQTPSSRSALDKCRFLKLPETRSCEHALLPKYAAD